MDTLVKIKYLAQPHRGEAMYISLIVFQWTSIEIKIVFNTLIIPNLIMIACISYGIYLPY